MAIAKPQASPLPLILSDYGMVLVLLLLCALFSALTLAEQHPTGAAAARQVAAAIASRSGRVGSRRDRRRRG